MGQFGALTSRNDCLGPQSDFKVFKVFKVLGLTYTLKTKIGNLRGIEQILQEFMGNMGVILSVDTLHGSKNCAS